MPRRPCVAASRCPTSGALSAADLDRLNAEQVAAQARVETAKADLHTAELRVRYGTVTAPDSGTITSRTVSVGQVAQAGQEMMRLLRQNRVEWRAEVPESQLSRIKVGQAVQVTAVDGSVLKGKVRAVAPTVQTNNRTGLAYVDINGGDARPGMFARGAIEAGKGPALLVAGGQRGDAGWLQLRVRGEDRQHRLNAASCSRPACTATPWKWPAAWWRAMSSP